MFNFDDSNSVNTGGADQVLIEELQKELKERPRIIDLSSCESRIRELEADCNIFMAEKKELYVESARQADKIEELKCELAEVKRVTKFKEVK